MPLVIPVVHADCEVQTVAVSDVATATRHCLVGALPAGRRFDLRWKQHRTPWQRLGHHSVRGWVCHRPRYCDCPRCLPVPWRWSQTGSPAWAGARRCERQPCVSLRTASPATQGRGSRQRHAFAGLGETPSACHRPYRERWFARLFLRSPVVVFTPAMFWLVTAAVTVINPTPALALLTSAGLTKRPRS